MRLNPKHLTLNGLLQGRLFRIPDYQRAYAWGTRQRNDLFADILEVHKSKQDHFMATVVSLARETRQIMADEFQVSDVVDGQQRLTTIIILLKAIEKNLDPSIQAEEKIRREISELLVKGDDHSLILLQTNHDNSHIFTNYMRTGKSNPDDIKTESDKNLIDAQNECGQFISEWKEKYSIIELVAILRNRLSFLYHEITDEATVYRVFEVLNSRGLDVKWIDKLKSQLMALIFVHTHDDSRKEALAEMLDIWRTIYRTLGLRSALGDEALRFAGTLKVSYRPNRLAGQEDAARALTQAAGSELKDIVGTASWLKSVVAAVDKIEQNYRLRAVTRIVHARFTAAAILLREFPQEAEKQLLEKWEKLTFRIFGLSGADSRYKVGDYIRLGYDIINKKLSADEIMKRLSKMGDGYSISEVLDGADWSQCYDGWSEELRYVLFRYDEYLASQAGEKLNAGQWNKIWSQDPSKSIEHITPQSSGKDYIHHIGNLTMLPPGVNSSLKDKPPANKADTYLACGLRATAAVGLTISSSAKGWNRKSVEKRGAEIVKFIEKEWAD